MTNKWPVQWQYNGCAPWNDIVQWCYPNLHGKWFADWETIYFKSEHDYFLFKLYMICFKIYLLYSEPHNYYAEPIYELFLNCSIIN
jgi:hypothetical protein